MGPKALIFIQSLARKSLTKGQGSGITKIPSAMQAEAKASEIFTNLVEAGLKPEMMDDFIRSEADVAKYLNILDAYKRERMKPIPADSPRGKEITEALFGKRGEVVDMKGNVIPEGSGIMGGESIESLMKSGDVTKGTVTKKSKKVTDRDMFRAANQRLGKPKTDVNTIIKNINSMEPIDAMKEANKVIKREGPYKNLNQQQAKKILEDTEDHIFERDVTPMDEDFAAGGRVGLKGGGMDMGAGSSKSSKSSGVDRSKVSAQQERNNQAAVREAQAFNQKKEETINRIKEAQPKQSPIKTFFNPRLQKHFDQNQMLKDAVARGEITPEQYNELGGYDVQQTLSLGNPLLGGIGNLIGSTGYNIVQSSIPSKDSSGNVIYEDTPFIIGEDANTIYSQTPKASQLLRDIPGDVMRNVQGGLGLISPELKQTYKNILAQGAGQYQTGGRVGLRYGGDTMGGINDKSISSPGPDRSKVSEQQERSHQEAISRARDSQQYDYTVPKQIAKDIAINTGKNLAGQKILSTLGIGATPITILMALKGLYDQTQNPVYSEEDLTYGVPYQTGGRVGLKGGGRTITLMDGTKVYIPEGSTTSSGGLKDRIYSSSKGDLLREDIVRLMSFESGGRVGLRGGGADFIPTEKMNTDRMKVIREFLKRKIPHLDSGPIDKSILYDLQEALSSGSGLFPGYDVRNDLPREVEAKGGGRIGLAGGMTRRAFLKLMGGVAAGIGAIKSGIMGVGKKEVAKKVVKEVIKTPPVAGKPEWFDALINKVILEGDDVTKKLATKDREIVHTKKLNDQESVTVTQDLDDGAIRVEYDSPDNLGQEPVMMQFKPGMADETTGGKKPADRFDVVETEPRYVGPDNTDIEFIGESGGPNISFIESDVTNLKTFATGKGPTMKEIVKSKKRKDLTRAVNENDYEAAEYLGGKYGDVPEPDFPDDYSGYASGGIAGMLGE
jgi:hypothetical protein